MTKKTGIQPSMICDSSYEFWELLKGFWQAHDLVRVFILERVVGVSENRVECNGKP